MKTRITIALVAILLIAGITFIIIKPNNITSSAVFNYDLAKANQGINLTQLFGQHTQFYIRPTEGINAAITNDILTVKSTEGEKTIVVYVIDGNKVVKHALSITNNTIKKIEPKIEEPKVEDEVKQELKQTNKVKVIITFTPEEQTYLQSLTPEKQIEEKKRIVKQKIEELKTKLSKKNELTGAATGIDEAVTITQEYETIEAIAAEITLEGLELLESNPEIQGVFIDRELSLQLSDSVPLIRADLVHGTLINGTNITGKGKAVCVLDTGIDYNHPAFTGRIIGGHDFVNNDDSAQDDNSISHGTHVSGIIASNNDSYKGVAPEANIVPTKVCNSQGSCSASNILAGIDYCTAHAAEYNITAISGSIGDGGSYNTDNCPTYFDNALSAATDLGIINVFASGNQGHTNGVSYPSCSPHTISVGASTKSDGLASFTNRGERLDILAPGTNILSTSIGGFRSLSGTSMSTPHVAGTIALLRQAADLTGKQITLNSTRKLLKDTGFNINTYLRIDAKRAADNIQPAPQQNKTNKTTAKTVKMNELLTDTRSNAPVAKKIQDDPNFETFFTNVTTNTTHLLVQFYHNGTTQQPVWVEGLSSLEAINLTNAPPNQEITVAVALINGYIPRFTLHVGPASDIFLFGITIINIQSYPTVGGNWTVIFNTSGQANLSITAINGTTFGTDLQFLKLTCGDTTLPTTWNGTSYVAPNYSCNTNGSEISKVLTPGKHTLQFNFGDSEAYAFNLAANSCPILINVSTELTNNVHSNGTCITFNAANITLNCQGFNITYDPGFNGGYAINNTNLTNNTIRDCFIRQTNWSATTGTAIFLYDANNTRIFNTSINVIDNRSFGIEMFRASSSIINNVTITSNQSPGIIITQSSNITIANTTVNTNTSDAIRINGSALISTSNNITLRDITAFSSNSSALSIISSGNITIINFTGISRNGTAYSHDFSTGDVTIRNSRFSTNESIAASIDGNRHHIYNTILSVSHGIALQLLTITDVNISNITLRTNSTWLTTNPVSNFMNLTNTLFEDDNGSIRIILNMTLGSSINISKSNLNITGNRVFVN
jgi:subtilisin family serine protease